MRASWIDRKDEGLWRRIFLSPLSIAAWGYGATAHLHREMYERGWRERRRLPCRVVSVGNLTVGGAGKTPTSAWLASRLAARGYMTVIASRGYGRKSRELVSVVSDGTRIHAGPGERGDEPLLLAAHSPGVPVLVGPDRGVVGLRAVSSFGAQVLVLDDGFQHHRLARDLEILVFDGARGWGNGHLLPRGPLREGKALASRADAIGVVDGPLPSADASELERLAPAAHSFRARRKPIELRRIQGDGSVPPEVLSGMKVGLLAGIANPDSLRRSLGELGAEVVSERIFADHYRYRARDLRGLKEEAEIWITTEKDAVKILPSWLRGLDLRVLTIRLEVEEPDALVDWVIGRLFEAE